MAKREVQLIGCGFARPIPLIEDGPLALLAAASLIVLLGYCARATDRSLARCERFRQGRPNRQAVYQAAQSFPERLQPGLGSDDFCCPRSKSPAFQEGLTAAAKEMHLL